MNSGNMIAGRHGKKIANEKGHETNEIDGINIDHIKQGENIMIRPTYNKKEKGFSLIELLIVLAVLGIILAISVPNLIDYYWQTRFTQEVQRVVATIRRSQFAAVSANQWYGLVVHQRCPMPLQSDKFCTQLFRLPIGTCNLATFPAGGSNWLNIQACAENNTGVLCEFPAERWIMEPTVRPEPDIAGDVPILYVIGPMGTISSQTATPTVAPICTDLPIPAQMPLVFSHIEKDSPFGYQYKGVCMTGRGNVRTTNTDDAVAFLSCDAQ